MHAKINAEGDELGVDGNILLADDGEIAQVQNEFETMIEEPMQWQKMKNY